MSTVEDIRRASRTLEAIGAEGHPEAESDPVGALCQAARDQAVVIRIGMGVGSLEYKERIEESARMVGAEQFADQPQEPPLVLPGQGRNIRHMEGVTVIGSYVCAYLAIASLVGLIAWALFFT